MTGQSATGLPIRDRMKMQIRKGAARYPVPRHRVDTEMDAVDRATRMLQSTLEKFYGSLFQLAKRD